MFARSDYRYALVSNRFLLRPYGATMPGFVRVIMTIKRYLAASMGTVFAKQSVSHQITVFVSSRYSMAMEEEISGRRSCVNRCRYHGHDDLWVRSWRDISLIPPV